MENPLWMSSTFTACGSPTHGSGIWRPHTHRQRRGSWRGHAEVLGRPIIIYSNSRQYEFADLSRTKLAFRSDGIFFLIGPFGHL